MGVLARLRAFLDENHVPYRVLTHDLAYTAQEVAAAQHVPGGEVAKVVMLCASGQPVMAVVPAPEKVDPYKVAPMARLAAEHEFTHLFPRCETGAMPPFGNLYGIAVHVDRRLAGRDDIVFQAGDHTHTVRMRYHDFARLVRPTVGDYVLEREEASAECR